jgi:hypothetical protein
MKKKKKPRLTKSVIDKALAQGVKGVKDLELQLNAVFRPPDNSRRLD